MRNLAFVAWMLGYPLVCATVRGIYCRFVYPSLKVYFAPTIGAVGIACLIEVATWIYVGVKLYEGKP